MAIPTVQEMEAYIRQAARARGIDPDIAVRAAKSEGLAPGVWQSRLPSPGGGPGRERSFGPFQLYMGGGLGNKMLKETGIDPSNPANWRQGVDYALNTVAQEGWGQWYGPRKAGIGRYDGIQGARPVAMGSFPDAPMQDFTGPVSERPLASFNDMGGGFGQLFSGLPFGDPNAPPDPMRFGDVQGPYTPVQEYDEMGGTMMAGMPGAAAGSGGSAWGGSGISREMADYAFGDDQKKEGGLAGYFKALGKEVDQHRPPRITPMGDARSSGNALTNVLNSPTVADQLLQRRMPFAFG